MQDTDILRPVLRPPSGSARQPSVQRFWLQTMPYNWGVMAKAALPALKKALVNPQPALFLMFHPSPQA